MGYKIEPKYVPELSECLNLGSGLDLRKGFVNMDKMDYELVTDPDIDYVMWDYERDRMFGYLLPFPHCTFDYVLARDVLEHVPHRICDTNGEFFVALINDLVRISKHGALWEFISPCRPDALGAAGHTRILDVSTFVPWMKKSIGRGSGENATLPKVLVTHGHENIRQWGITDYTRFGRAIVKRLSFRVFKQPGGR